MTQQGQGGGLGQVVAGLVNLGAMNWIPKGWLTKVGAGISIVSGVALVGSAVLETLTTGQAINDAAVTSGLGAISFGAVAVGLGRKLESP